MKSPKYSRSTLSCYRESVNRFCFGIRLFCQGIFVSKEARCGNGNLVMCDNHVAMEKHFESLRDDMKHVPTYQL